MTEDTRIFAGLEDRFGNCAGAIIVMFKRYEKGTISKEELVRYAKDARRTYIQDMKLIIAENLPPYKGLTSEHLSELVELAESLDWSIEEEFDSFKEKYREIKAIPETRQQE